MNYYFDSQCRFLDCDTRGEHFHVWLIFAQENLSHLMNEQTFSSSFFSFMPQLWLLCRIQGFEQLHYQPEPLSPHGDSGETRDRRSILSNNEMY